MFIFLIERLRLGTFQCNIMTNCCNHFGNAMLSTRFNYFNRFTSPHSLLCKLTKFSQFCIISMMGFLLTACGGGAGTVGTPSSTALYTTAASSITIPIDKVSYTIGGGTAIYKSTSSNTSVATTSVSGTTLNIIGVTSGAAQITVTDAVGATVNISVTVGSGTTAPALFVNAPSAINLGINVSTTYTIAGGKPNYVVSSSNTAVATLSTSGNSFTVTGISAGTAQIVIFDSVGDSVSVVVTVGSGGSNVPLFTTAASALSLAINEIGKFNVGGGTGPYIATSSNTSIATASVTGSTLTINGVSAGAVQVVIFDGTGVSVTLSITVGDSTNNIPLFTVAPSTINVSVNSSTMSYSIGGGKAPYKSTSSNTDVVTTSINNNQLLVTGKNAGIEQVLIFDSLGASISITVNVGSSTSNTDLFVASANAITIAPNTSNVTFTVGGGAPVYSASSSNTSVATVSISGSTLTINSLNSGTVQVIVFDTKGNSVSLTVTVGASSSSSSQVAVLPENATGNVGNSLVFLVNGGTPAYTITVNNPSIATVTPTTVGTNGGSFTANLLNTGSTEITVTDATGQTKSFTLTVSQVATSLRLSPESLTVAEDSTADFSLNIFGGTGPYTAFTSDQTLSSVSTTGSILTVGLGTKLNRCINPIDESGTRVPFGTFNITLTVVDSLGASATSILTIKDNGVGTGSVVTQPAPFVAPCQ